MIDADALGDAPIDTLIPLAVLDADGDAEADVDADGDGDADADTLGEALGDVVAVTDGGAVAVTVGLDRIAALAPPTRRCAFWILGQAPAPGPWVMPGQGRPSSIAALGGSAALGDAVAGSIEATAAATPTPRDPIATETVTLFAREDATAAFMRKLRMLHRSFETRHSRREYPRTKTP